MAQGRVNGAPNKTWTHSWKFSSIACWPLHHPRRPSHDCIIICWTFCSDLAQGRINGATNGTWTHLWRFASLASKPLHYPRRPYIMGLIDVYFLLTPGFEPWMKGTGQMIWIMAVLCSHFTVYALRVSSIHYFLSLYYHYCNWVRDWTYNLQVVVY